MKKLLLIKKNGQHRIVFDSEDKLLGYLNYNSQLTQYTILDQHFTEYTVVNTTTLEAVQ
jgi:hypothetical protein